jgi:superfamily II DNA or RNA helicase
MKQWEDQIIKWTNVKKHEIGIVQGPKCQYRDKKIVLAMIHTLAAKFNDFPPDFYRSFGTVAFDECHVVGAETFSKVAPLFWSRYRIGLTATPRRSDGMDPVFWWHLGPVLSRFTKLQAKARVRILGYNGKDTSHAGMVWGGNLNLGRYFNRIAKSPERMKLLHQVVKALADKSHDVLVLADRISLLENLKSMLIASGVQPSMIGMLTGSIKQLDRKVILGTYGSAGMGVDIPRLTALVMATPRAEIEQAVGRVLRQGDPLVIDIVDTASSIMCGWAMSRKKFYTRITDDIQDRVGLVRVR